MGAFNKGLSRWSTPKCRRRYRHRSDSYTASPMAGISDPRTRQPTEDVSSSDNSDTVPGIPVSGTLGDGSSEQIVGPFHLDDDTQHLDAPDAIKITGQHVSQIKELLVKARNAQDSGEDLALIITSLSEVNGNRLVNVLVNMPQDELIASLRVVDKLGRLKDENCRFALSGLSCAVLLNFLFVYVNPEVRRRAMALFWHLLSDHERLTEPLAELLGCGKSTIYAGFTEFEESGLIVDTEHPYAPGAGRPTVEKSFREAMTGISNAAGLKTEDLEARTAQCNLSRESAAVQQLVDEKENTDQNPEGPSQQEKTDQSPIELSQKEEEARLVPAEEIDVSNLCHEVIEAAAPALEKLYGVMNRAKTGNIVELKLFCKNVTEFEDWLLMALEKHCDLFAEGYNPEGPGETPEERARALTAQFRSVYYSIFVLAADSFLAAFKDINNVVAKYGSTSSYIVMKELGRCKTLKNTACELAVLKLHYEQLEQAIGALALTAAPQRADLSGTDSEFPEAPVLNLEAAGQELEQLIIRLNKALESTAAASSWRKIRRALDELSTLKKWLDEPHAKKHLENVEFLCSLAILAGNILVKVRSWLAAWDEGANERRAAATVASQILSSRNKATFKTFMDNCALARKASEAMDATDALDGKEQSDEGAEVTEALRSEILSAVKKAQDGLSFLRKLLETGEKNKRSNVKNSNLPKAMDFIKETSGKLASLEDKVKGSEKRRLWNVLAEAARIMILFKGKWLKSAMKADGTYFTTYSDLKRVAQSILSERYRKAVADFFNSAESCDDSGEKGEEEPEGVWDCFTSDGQLPRQRLLQLVRKMWNEGKDPTSITTWMEYIVHLECRRTYADPSGRALCCRITEEELANALRYLTGLRFSGRALHDILCRDLGYGKRQAEKLDQIGSPSEYREVQYQYIATRVADVDRSACLIASIDTKAFVVLGNFKHDNSVLLCGPNSVYRVLDHDFALKIREIYPDGTDLLDCSRWDEMAILHPVGVFCENDNTAYVALILGKDTAESMADLISKVIEKKRAETMPGLKQVLILADGGGANMANGIVWQSELLRISEDTKTTLEVLHFPPGTSRHNPIEHFLWSYVSIHWKGKPFLSIEQVVRYVSETTTHSKTRPNNLHVECWFEPKKYLTNKEKKANGEAILTRAELEEKANGRITHPFPQGTDQYKWNYIITPSA